MNNKLNNKLNIDDLISSVRFKVLMHVGIDPTCIKSRDRNNIIAKHTFLRVLNHFYNIKNNNSTPYIASTIKTSRSNLCITLSNIENEVKPYKNSITYSDIIIKELTLAYNKNNLENITEYFTYLESELHKAKQLIEELTNNEG